MKSYDNLSVEDITKRAKQMASQADKDLDDMIKNDPELRNLKKKNSIDLDDPDVEFANSDDELDALENELKGIKPPKKGQKIEKKKGKSDSDKALENLEIEDDHKVKDEEKSKVNAEEKPIETISKSGIKIVKDQPIIEEIQEPKPTVKDLYPPQYEKKFHKHEEYKCMGVLLAEVDLMSEIVEFKKKNGFEPNHFENKVVFLNITADKIRNLIENELMTIDIYKNTITAQKNYENSILAALSQKKDAFDKEVYDIIVERINKRIALIDSELAEEIPEEEEEAPSDVKPIEEASEVKVENSQETEISEDNLKKPEKIPEQPVEIPKEKEKPAPIKEEPKIIIDQELVDRCKKKFEDYKVANRYFIDNGFTELAQDAANKASLIFKEIQKLLKGELIDEFGLPIDITPDYINGCSRKDRVDKFMSIAKDFVERKNKLNESLKEVSEKLKLLDKRDLEKNSEQIKKMISEKKQKIENYDKIIKKLVELSKNQWVPCPLFSLSQEDEKIEVTNSDIPQYCLKISIGKNNYLKEGSYINLILPISEKRTHTEIINPKKVDDYQYSSILKLEKSEFNSIYKKAIEIQVFKKR